MRIRSDFHGNFGRGVVSIAGTVCVVATFALLSPGVRIARADESSRAPSAAPVASPASDPAPKAAPFVKAEDVEQARRPGVSGIEIAPGVVVLNTRGFNYGPPPTPLAPEALEAETSER